MDNYRQAGTGQRVTCPICKHQVTASLYRNVRGDDELLIDAHGICRGSFRPSPTPTGETPALDTGDKVV